MNEQPRRNEDRFYRYPMNRVVASIDDDAGLDASLRALQASGIDVTQVHVLSGADGARLLDQSGKRHGVRGRLLRLLQRGAYESDALLAHERVLKQGGHVIYVPVHTSDERSRVVDILRRSSGHDLMHFRRWSIERLRGTG